MLDLLVLLRPAKRLQNGAGLVEKLERSGLAKKKRVALMTQCEQFARMSVTASITFQVLMSFEPGFCVYCPALCLLCLMFSYLALFLASLAIY